MLGSKQFPNFTAGDNVLNRNTDQVNKNTEGLWLGEQKHKLNIPLKSSKEISVYQEKHCFFYPSQ